MGEWTYLSVEHRDGSTRALLGAKRHYPFAWALAFEELKTAPADGKLSASFDGAVDRLRRRAKKLAKRAGPKLSAVLDGFVEFVADQDGARLVYDASEMASAYGSADELVGVIELAAKLDARKPTLMRDDLGEWGIDDGFDDDEDRPEFLELDDVYLFFGGSVDGDLAWLRPPEPGDDERIAAIRSVFDDAGYVLEAGPTFAEEAVTLVFSHPRHRGVAFVVDDSLVFSAHRAARVENGRRPTLDFDAIDFGPEIDSIAKLGAWARHVAEHFGMLAPTSPNRSTAWWARGGAETFGEAMPVLDEDLERARASFPDRLAAAIRELFWRLNMGASTSIDLGRGSLVVERVADPAWEPHFRASLRREPGDAAWRWPKPDFLVPPTIQHRVATEWLDALEQRARAGGAVIVSNDDRPQLTLFGDRVEPERFVPKAAGRFDELLPARTLSNEEVPGRYAFVGANLVIVTTDDTRTAFKFEVPSDFDDTIPPLVSGFWTAKSGQRFASRLRVGQRVWRFDNDGKLLESG